MAFNFSKAICRNIPKSLITEALRMDTEHTPINYEKACEEHDQYIKTLKKLGLEVVLLEADESFPDCVFVEDTAVVCGDRAILTNTGHVSRRGEKSAIKKTLEDLKIKVNVMKEPAKMDGGDVLFTGREFFVGLSTRTTKEGMDALQETFPAYPVHGIEISDGALHLKSMMSLVGEDIIAIGNSESAQHALRQMQNKMQFKYKILKVSHDAAANALFINGHVIRRCAWEFPGIEEEFGSLPYEKLELPNTELCKVDGALTCCSLLIQ